MPVAATAACLISNAFAALVAPKLDARRPSIIKPKVFIIGMFDPEADVWYGIEEFDVLAVNVTVPGLSPVYPDVHCTADGDVCQITIG